MPGAGPGSLLLLCHPTGAMQRKRGVGLQAGENDNGVGSGSDGVTAEAAPSGTAATAVAPVLRRPRHGGYKGTAPGREAQMLRGEPGYHLGG